MYDDHFGIENIPFGIASSASHPNPSVVTRFEDTVIFIDVLISSSLIPDVSEDLTRAFSQVSILYHVHAAHTKLLNTVNTERLHLLTERCPFDDPYIITESYQRWSLKLSAE